MRWLSRLQQKLEPYAIPNLPLWLIAGQGMLYGVSVAEPDFTARLALVPNAVLGGEYWRLLSFLFIPPITNLLFLFCAFYFFYLMGTALEHHWGTLRFNVYLFIGYAATLAAAFAFPSLRDLPHTNAFIGSSVFLAFAKLYPNYVITIFLIIPVRVYWIATFTWIGIVYSLVAVPDWSYRVSVVAGIANYLLFFFHDVFYGAVRNERRMRRQITNLTRSHQEPIQHRCVVCGLTEQDDPNADFRYCSQCDGTPCYCNQHLRDHQHLKPGNAAEQPR